MHLASVDRQADGHRGRTRQKENQARSRGRPVMRPMVNEALGGCGKTLVVQAK